LTCGRYGATGFVVQYKTETLSYTAVVTVVAQLSPECSQVIPGIICA